MKQTAPYQVLIIIALMYLPVLWIALLVAQSTGSGLPEFLAGFSDALQNPFYITWTDNSPKTVLICTAVYLVAVGIYFSTIRNTRDGEEHGSARWTRPAAVNAVLAQKENILLTRHVSIGMNTRKHGRNLNILVIGGSGAKKTRGFCKPALLSANSNFVVTDPKSELLSSTGSLLRQKGYELRVLNLVNMAQSDGFNPFAYLRDEKDALRMVNTLIQATTPKGARESDPFWVKSETALLQAIVLFLHYEAPETEQNLSMITRMLEYAEVKEDDEDYLSPLDLLFLDLEMEQPEHIAVRQYKVFRQARGRTAMSIIVSAAVRLAAFSLPQLKAITDHDDMDLYTLGEKKVALFAVIPDNDNTFHFLVSLLYACAFQTLYYSADQIHGGSLPRHVRFILDEFASMPLPGYTRELATMRSRNISSDTIIQNIAQIKELYKDSWETIFGNSDTILFLGGNETSTHKLISGALGKASISTKTHGQTQGRSGNYSTNFQITGRELLTPDEVRLLDDRYAILLIRGTLPVMDLKYDLNRHPNIRYSSDGGAPPYIHNMPFYKGQEIATSLTQSAKENAIL